MCPRVIRRLRQFSRAACYQDATLSFVFDNSRSSNPSRRFLLEVPRVQPKSQRVQTGGTDYRSSPVGLRNRPPDLPRSLLRSSGRAWPTCSNTLLIATRIRHPRFATAPSRLLTNVSVRGRIYLSDRSGIAARRTSRAGLSNWTEDCRKTSTWSRSSRNREGGCLAGKQVRGGHYGKIPT